MVVPRPNIELGVFSIDISGSLAFYTFVAVLFILSFIIINRIVHSPFGRVLKGIRENESRARSVGYNIKQFKLMAFVFSGMFTGLAGGLYGLFIKFAHISNVAFDTSAKIVMMSLAGGIGTLFGPIIGAGFVTILSELLSAIWPRWLMIVGALFLTFVLYMRGGIWGVASYVFD
jgi:branched-chain amino acid transport system permease protein